MPAKKKSKPMPEVSKKSKELVDAYKKAIVFGATGAMLGADTLTEEVQEENEAFRNLLKHIAALEAYRKRFFGLANRKGWGG